MAGAKYSTLDSEDQLFSIPDTTPFVLSRGLQTRRSFSSSWQLNPKLTISVSLNVLLSIILTTSLIITLTTTPRDSLTEQEELHQPLKNPQSLFQKTPTSRIEFNDSIYQLISSAGDKLWKDLQPIGEGFLRIPHPRQYDMAPSALSFDDSSEIYGVSVIHQLHCLTMFRNLIIADITQSGERTTDVVQKHNLHCLDYLRQAIMCSGDTTLEPVLWDTGPFVHGLGVKHRCHDWSAIVDFLVLNKADLSSASRVIF